MPNALLTKVTLDVGGTEVPIDNITRLEVTSALNRPAELVLSIHEPGDNDTYPVADDPKWKVKAEVTLTIEPDAGGAEKVFEGEITSVSLEVEAGATFLTVRAHDKLQWLFHGGSVAAHKNRKYSDLITTLITDAGLSAEVEATTHEFPMLYKAWATPGDQILAMAEELGVVVWMDNGKVNVKKPDFTASPVATFALGTGEILRFRADQSVTDAVGAVEVRGWDPKAKRSVVGTADGGKLTTEGIPVETQAHTKFSNETLSISAPAISDVAVADTFAEGVARRVGHAGGSAEGTVKGAPKLKPGVVIEIDKAPTRFKGKYFITEARHTLIDGEYETDFRCSASLAGVPRAGLNARPASLVRHPLQQAQPFTVLPAEVTDVGFQQHPDDLGPAAKVKFPTLDDTMESDWLRVVTPGSGTAATMMFPPSVGDEVLVAFADGDIRNGYILGGLFNGTDKPHAPLEPDAVTDGEIKARGFSTATGLKVLLQDDGGNQQILICDKAENQILIDGQDEKIMIVDQNLNEVLLSSDGISLESPKDITVKATGNMKFEPTGNFEIKATGNVTIEGMQVDVKANTTAKVAATMAELNGSAQTTVKGGLVMIN